MMMKVTLDGVPFSFASAPDQMAKMAEMAGIDPARLALDPEDLAAWEAEQRIAATRAEIGIRAGDAETILGTVADAGQLLLFAHASLVLALSQVQTLKDVRDAAEPFAARAQDFLAKVDDGRVILPFMLKGESATTDEIEARATAVSEAMIAVAYPDT